MKAIPETGPMNIFSFLLFDARFPRMFSARYSVKKHARIEIKIEEIPTVMTSPLIRNTRAAIARMRVADPLAIRNFIGRTLYFPPQAKSPKGNPAASRTWKFSLTTDVQYIN